MIDHLDINGSPPSVTGKVCQELLAEDYYFAGVLDSPASVVHFQIGCAWYRLYFDCGIIFWRNSDAPPEGCQMPELNAEFRIRDLGEDYKIRGALFDGIAMYAIEGGAEVKFSFSGNRVIYFSDINDTTTHHD